MAPDVDRCTTTRRQRLERYLTDLDRGELITGRILQVFDDGWVRVAVGPGLLQARTLNGRPQVGDCQLEVVAPGLQPTFRLVGAPDGRGWEVRGDATRDKRERANGWCLDRRA